MRNFMFSREDIKTFHRDGYLVKKGFFTSSETEKVYQTAVSDTLLQKQAYDLDDKDGLKTKLTLWFHPGDDIYGLLTRSQRMVTGVTALLGGTSAHFHTKLMQKEPKIGGAWEWHQDYGYWYKNGFLFPDMISVMVALTSANKSNGCLQVLKGSHKLQRVEHGSVGEQVGIKPELIKAVTERFELIYVELEPGDTLFFHCNLWHRSDANRSESSRWSLISAYNLVENKPYLEANESCITPIKMVPDEAIMDSGAEGIKDTADFLSKDSDSSLEES